MIPERVRRNTCLVYGTTSRTKRPQSLKDYLRQAIPRKDAGIGMSWSAMYNRSLGQKALWSRLAGRRALTLHPDRLDQGANNMPSKQWMRTRRAAGKKGACPRIPQRLQIMALALNAKSWKPPMCNNANASEYGNAGAPMGIMETPPMLPQAGDASPLLAWPGPIPKAHVPSMR